MILMLQLKNIKMLNLLISKHRYEGGFTTCLAECCERVMKGKEISPRALFLCTPLTTNLCY